MNREEAIDKADALVSAWMEQVKNQRGYVHDAWKPADPAARTEAVLKIANFLYEADPLPETDPLPKLVPIDPNRPPHSTCVEITTQVEMARGERRFVCAQGCPPAPVVPPPVPPVPTGFIR